MESKDFANCVSSFFLSQNTVIAFDFSFAICFEVTSNCLWSLIARMELNQVKVWIAEESVEHTHSGELVLQFLSLFLGHFFC